MWHPCIYLPAFCISYACSGLSAYINLLTFIRIRLITVYFDREECRVLDIRHLYEHLRSTLPIFACFLAFRIYAFTTFSEVFSRSYTDFFYYIDIRTVNWVHSKWNKRQKKQKRGPASMAPLMILSHFFFIILLHAVGFLVKNYPSWYVLRSIGASVLL